MSTQVTEVTLFPEQSIHVLQGAGHRPADAFDFLFDTLTPDEKRLIPVYGWGCDPAQQEHLRASNHPFFRRWALQIFRDWVDVTVVADRHCRKVSRFSEDANHLFYLITFRYFDRDRDVIRPRLLRIDQDYRMSMYTLAYWQDGDRLGLPLQGRENVVYSALRDTFDRTIQLVARVAGVTHAHYVFRLVEP